MPESSPSDKDAFKAKRLCKFCEQKPRKHGSRCEECWREYQRSYYQNSPRMKLAGLKRRLWTKYRMTLEEYETYVEWHEGKCAICKSEPTGEGQQGERLHVDHDHKTGLVRGLLCGNCNRAIGLLKDDSDLLRAAAGYLEFHDEWNREVYPHVYER